LELSAVLVARIRCAMPIAARSGNPTFPLPLIAAPDAPSPSLNSSSGEHHDPIPRSNRLEAAKPLTIETITISGPKPGEVLVEIMATGVRHTDAYTLSGMDRKGNFRPSSAMRARASCAKSARASPP